MFAHTLHLNREWGKLYLFLLPRDETFLLSMNRDVLKNRNVL